MSRKKEMSGSTGYLRVAVAQLDYHPAAGKGSGDPLSDPIYSPKRAGSSLLPPGDDAAPVALHREWNELRSRVRTAHTVRLGERVQAIVDACRGAGVKLLVLPEYSIPPSLLPELALLSQGVAIVAGSHLADMTGPDGGVYDSLEYRGELEPLHERNVSPVLFEGKLIALVPKLHLSKPELRFASPGKDWAPVGLPSEYGGPLGLLICLDYLHREKEVTERIKDCAVIAAPTLTPEHTIGDDFQPMASRDSRRFHKPVLQANDAKGGGSSIYVDEGRREDVRRFPLHAGQLEAGEEGVVIADIDIQPGPPGGSTEFDVRRPILPHAAASLVYAGIERNYAAWTTELRAILDDERSSVIQRVKAAREMVQRTPPPLPERGTARHRRLTLLLQDIAEESSLDRIRQLTREVVLPENVLPLLAVRAALARGAADAIHRWVDNPALGAGAFGPVEQELRGAWSRGERALGTYSVTARKALDETSDAVRGGPAPVPREQQELRVMTYEQVLVEGWEEDARDALSLLKQDRHAEGRDRFRTLLARVERAAANEPSEALRRKSATYRLHIATATLNLQELEAAREQALAIEPADLAPTERLVLVEALAMLGEQQRAEAVLPAKTDIEADALEKYRAAVQMLAISRGELPDDVVDSPTVRLGAAFLALTRKDMARAAREALAAIQVERGHLFVAHAVGLLSDALNRTVNELPPDVVPIPVEDRARVIDTLEARFPELRSAPLPEALLRSVATFEAIFHALIHDQEALVHAPDPEDLAPPDAEGEAFHTVRDRVFELVKERKPAEAIALLPPDDHPWRQRMNRVDIWGGGGEPTRALEEALALVRDVPDKAPVEYAAAQLLLRASRWDEALVHAEKAFKLFPGFGQRLLFAQALLAVGKTEEAWNLLQPLRSSDRIAALRTLAKAADESLQPIEAVAFLRKLVERAPEDVYSKLILAQRLAFLHRHEEAADLAWRTFEAHRDRLDIHGIHLCGSLQQFPRAEPRTAEDRIKQAAHVLFERFPGDASAEQARLNLLRQTGKFPDGTPPIQFDLLVEAGYAYRGNGVDEIVGWMRQRQQMQSSIQTLAQSGAIPAWTLCQHLALSFPLLLTRLLDPRRDGSVPWCPPVRAAGQQTRDDVRGATLVLSDLEISLILSLDRALGIDLWRQLRDHLGGGSLVVPAAAYQRMLLAAAEGLNADRQKLADVDGWIAQMDRLPSPERHSPGEDDEAVAARLGIPIVDTDVREGVPSVSPRALLALLRHLGILDGAQEQAIARRLPEEDGAPQPLPDLPRRALLAATLLHALVETDTLRPVVAAFKGGLSLGPVAVATIRGDRQDLHERVQAATLADKIHAALAEAQESGWLRVLSLEEPSMPPLREGTTDTERALILAPTREALALHELLAKNPTWLRTTADFFGERVVVTPETIRTLLWEVEHFQQISERMHQVEPRTLTVPDLVRAIVRDRRQRERALLVLAELGFSDALGPPEMLELERRYGGLDKGEPARLLDRQEWVAWSPGHVGGEIARVWLAQAYGDVLLRAFVTEEGEPSPDRSDAEKQALVRAVLSRMERLARRTGSDVLDQTLAFVGSRTVSQFRWFWKAEGESAFIDTKSAVAQLWRDIADWVGAEAARRGAFGRAFRDLWVLMAASFEDPGDVGVATLHAAASWRFRASTRDTHSRKSGAARGNESTPDTDFLEPEVEPLAILSGLWTDVAALAQEGVTATDNRTGSTVRITNAEVLRHGAALLEHPQERLVNERYVAFGMPVGRTGGVIAARAPVEALLLRAEPLLRASVASKLKALQGPHDGVLYTLLEAIERAPEDRGGLLAYAKRASNALFRLIRDDPAYLAVWPGAHRMSEVGETPDLDTLRAILSEPTELPPHDQSPTKWLGKRVMGGVWSERVDRGDLVVRASEIPGLLPAAILRLRLDQPEYAEQVAAALDGIENTQNEPIARIAGHVLFLRVAAAQRPFVQLPQGHVDLRELLPARFARLVATVRADPEPDTMAACEASLLRLCGQVVKRLARYRPIPMRDGLWLTYRLFQWLCAQLEAMAPDARLDAYRRLRALAPEPRDTTDILDPFGFDRHRFDHRLAAVLHALVTMEELARVFAEQPPGESESGDTQGRAREIRSVSSPQLESHLVEIAQGVARPGPTKSELDWESLGNVPDLALFALLTLNPGALDRVSPEARTRRWEALPLTPEGKSPERALQWRLVSAVADQAHVLTADERTLLEGRLRAMPAGETAQHWRWVVWIGLLAAGAGHLEGEARALTEEHIREPLAPLLSGRLLVALTSKAPERLADEADALRAAAEKAGADAVDVTVTAVVRVALHGAPDAKQAAFALLRRLAREAPFADNPGMRTVIGFFNLGEPET